MSTDPDRTTQHLTRFLPAPVIDARKRGQSVIPMGANKRPLVRWKAYQIARTPGQEILCWLDQFSEQVHGWARITGALAGVIVLDDDKAGWMERLGLEPHVRTGSGGYHWIGQHPGWRVKTLNSKSGKRHGEKYPNLDIRGDGGYSVIAGYSQKGGYTWLRSADPDPLDVLPRELREFFGLWAPPSPTVTVAPRCAPSVQACTGRVPAEILVNRALDEMRLSGRNNAGFWLAIQLRDNGYDRIQALEIGRQYVAAAPPTNTKGEYEEYDLAEFEQSIDQAYSAPARSSWGRQYRRPRPLPPPVRPKGVLLSPPVRPSGVIWPAAEIRR
jgi:hypothetical protein